jgi:colanic acid/amylovoran biosynthesis glycosyltransferase
MENLRVAALTQTFPFGSGETFIDDEALAWGAHPRFRVLWFPSSKTDEQRFKPAESVSPEKRLLTKIFQGLRHFPWIAFLFELREIAKLGSSRFIPRLFILFRQGLQAGVRIRCLLREERFDVYYSYWATPDAVAAQQVAKNHESISIVRSHGSDLYEGIASDYLPFRRFLTSAAGQPTKHVYLCDSARLFADSRFGSSPYLVAPLGIRSSPGMREKENKNSHFEAPYTFVSASNLSPVKRLYTVAEVLNILFGQGLVSTWHHFGGAPSEIDTLLSNINIKFRERVRFHGFLKNDDFREKLETLNNAVFINLSSSEGMPVTLMEAMAAGMPIVATDVGCISELVLPQAGLLVSAKSSSKDLSGQISEWLMDFDLSQGARFSRQHVNANHRASDNYRKLLIEIEECVDYISKGQTNGR